MQTTHLLSLMQQILSRVPSMGTGKPLSKTPESLPSELLF